MDLGSENRVPYLDPGPQKEMSRNICFEKRNLLSSGFEVFYIGEILYGGSKNDVPSIDNKNLGLGIWIHQKARIRIRNPCYKRDERIARLLRCTPEVKKNTGLPKPESYNNCFSFLF